MYMEYLEKRRAIKRWLLIFLILPAAPIFGANINVPSLELYTRGNLRNGIFGFSSRGEMDLLVDGGYKFGGRIVLGFNSTTLEEDSLDGTSLLSFKTASITFRDVFKLPMDFTYFIGEEGTLGSGDIYPDFFGTVPIATRYRGYLYFPDGIIFDGIHTINGTGFQLDLFPNKELFLLSLYLYQDSMVDADGDPLTFDPGYYSADIRPVLNFEKVKLEAFLGTTFPAPDSTVGYYRGGLLFYAAEEGVEFLTQLGIPRWSPLTEALGIHLFYLLFEPRIRTGPLSIIPTFFWRPVYYHQQETGERALDVNLNIQLGRPPLNPVSGGIEGNFTYLLEMAGTARNELRLKLSPYIMFAAPGMLWEIRLNTKLMPFTVNDMFECFLTIKAEF